MKILDKKMRIAVIQARKSDFRNQLGAVAYMGNRILTMGINQIRGYKLDPVIESAKEWKDSLHAEADVIRKLLFLQKKGTKIKFENIHLYICRLKKDGSLGISKPCPSCMKLIEYVNIKYISYIASDGNIETLRL